MNHMKIKSGFERRKESTLEQAMRVMTDYNAGMSMTEILYRYKISHTTFYKYKNLVVAYGHEKNN